MLLIHIDISLIPAILKEFIQYKKVDECPSQPFQNRVLGESLTKVITYTMKYTPECSTIILQKCFFCKYTLPNNKYTSFSIWKKYVK